VPCLPAALSLTEPSGIDSITIATVNPLIPAARRRSLQQGGTGGAACTPYTSGRSLLAACNGAQGSYVVIEGAAGTPVSLSGLNVFLTQPATGPPAPPPPPVSHRGCR
jgi:hypothetical protein